MRVLFAALLAIPVLGGTARAADDLGSVVIVDEVGEPLRNGSSATPFSVQLPDDAVCPGDSMSDQWRYQGFMVPAGADVGAVTYGVVGPEGEGQFALYTVTGSPLADELLQANGQAGQPGRFPGLAMLNFAAFPPGLIPAGTYRLGIACTLLRETSQYWDTEIVVEASSEDQPAGLVWRLPDAPSYEPSDPGRSWWWKAGLGLVVAGPLATLFFIQRSRSGAARSKERS